jgi:hypothetical protein
VKGEGVDDLMEEKKRKRSLKSLHTTTTQVLNEIIFIHSNTRSKNAGSTK